MKKITKTFIALVALVLFASSQLTVKAQAFQNESMVVNGGLGFGWYGYTFAGNASVLPAISVSLEKGIKELDFGILSVGGITGFKHANYDWSYYSDNYKNSWTDIIIAARGAVHIDVLKDEKIDTYGGVAVGLKFHNYTRHYPVVYPSVSIEKESKTSVSPLFAFYIGGRYYLTDKLAGFGELGWGLGYFTIGLSYKLK